MDKQGRNGGCNFSLRLLQSLRWMLPLIVLVLLAHLLVAFRAVGRISTFSGPSPAINRVLGKWEWLLKNGGDCDVLLAHARARLRDSVVFLPLRGSAPAVNGQTNIIVEINATFHAEQAQHLRFPSPASGGRLLCLAGNDSQDGMKNSYALAWPDALPDGAVFLSGLTFVSENFYDYKNLCHGLGAVLPFVAWYNSIGCREPARWVLYKRGELQREISPWLNGLVEASMGEVRMETLDRPACFEEAVLFRHNEGQMALDTKMRAFDLIRCKARAYCNVSDQSEANVRLTLLLRTGARSFKNESAVVEIFRRACVGDCRLTVAWAANVGGFCEQVRLMSETDVLATPHGAQLTNMFFMDKNSSVMEFFPSGWKETAGSGQFVYHWLAAKSGMSHRGVWRDTGGPECDTPEDRIRCFSLYYKDQQLGHDEKQFYNWTVSVIDQAREVKLRKRPTSQSACDCAYNV